MISKLSSLKANGSSALRSYPVDEKKYHAEALRAQLDQEIHNPSLGNYCGVGSNAVAIINRLAAIPHPTFEPEQASATRVAAGMLAPVGELSFGEPELLELTLAAAELYPDFVAEIESASGHSTGYRRSGALHVALDRDEAAQLRRVHELQRSRELEAEWLSPRGCRQLEPGLTPSCNGGVHAAGEAAVDPRALTAFITRSY